MTSRYLDVSRMFDDNSNQLYENLTKSAISSSARDFDSEVSDLVEEFKNEECITAVTEFEQKIGSWLNSEIDSATDLDDLKNVMADFKDSVENMNDDWSLDLDDDSLYKTEGVIEDYEAFLNKDTDHEVDLDDVKKQLKSDINEMRENLNEIIENSINAEKKISSILSNNLGLDSINITEFVESEQELSDYVSDWMNEQYDFAEPIYNYVYPINRCPSDSKIAEINAETPLVVIEADDEYYLASCTCGMDITQYVGYAKGVILDETLSLEDCSDISKQRGLNISGEKFDQLMQKISESLETHIWRANRVKDEVDALLPKVEEKQDGVDEYVQENENKQEAETSAELK